MQDECCDLGFDCRAHLDYDVHDLATGEAFRAMQSDTIYEWKQTTLQASFGLVARVANVKWGKNMNSERSGEDKKC